jgi:hypothetical protein
MRQIIALFLILVSLNGFVKKQQGVYVSFRNGSEEAFKSLHVKISGQDYYFKDLKSGESTKPINVKKTYRYCYAEVIANRDTLIFQPIDYVGETLHKSGSVTMELYIFPEKGTNRDLRIR